jgi:hypothetical protein
MRRIAGKLIALGALLLAGLLPLSAEAATLYISEFQSRHRRPSTARRISFG